LNSRNKTQILNEILGYSWEKGSETLFKCPACNHHKRKLSVNLDKNVFKCWVCDYRGRNLRRLVRRFGSFTQLQLWDALDNTSQFQRFADLFVERGSEEPVQKIDLPDEFLSLATLRVPATGHYALKYLKSRGVTEEDVLKWKMGFCFSGEYRNRVIIPSFNEDGDINYFVARSYNGDSYKYKNPRVSKNIVFNDLYVNWQKDLVIVEGVFDAVIAGNAVPLLGSTLRSDAPLIKKIVFNDTPVYLALDPDAAAKERKIIKTLSKYDIELYKIDVSGYEDVGSMPRSIFEERKAKAVFIDNNDYLLLDLLSAV